MALPPLMKLVGVLLVGTSGWTLLQHADVAKATQPSEQPAAYGPTERTAQAPPQAPSATEAALPFLIVPGQSVGPVHLGRPIREELVQLGPAKNVKQLGDGTRMYRWFEPPSNTGIGVRTNQNGTVLIVWVLNDARYTTKEGLHVGSTEAEILSALGTPTRVESNSEAKTKTLIYESLGSWFTVQLDQQLNFYNTVFDIGVMAKASPQVSPPPPASAPQVSPPPPASAPQASPPPPVSAPQASPPPSAAAPQTSPPTPDNRLYTLRIGLSDRDRATAIAKQLLAGGFAEARVTVQTGFRVVSEPLPRSVAEGLVASLAGRGFHSQIEPLTGDTVQLLFGAFTSQKDAETLSQRITAAGYDTWVREGTVYMLQFGPYPQSSVNTITGIIKSGAPDATVTAVPAP